MPTPLMSLYTVVYDGYNIFQKIYFKTARAGRWKYAILQALSIHSFYTDMTGVNLGREGHWVTYLLPPLG